MNTYKKFLFAGFLALGVLFVVTDKVEAAVQWNTAGNDCPTVMVANHTTQQGVNSPCWTTSTSANGGETVNVRIYYHNTGDTTATNTRLRLNPISSGSQSSFTFTGYVTGGNITRSGSGSVSLSSSQTLTLGSIKWYPNQCSSSGCAQTISNPSNIFTSSGVSVGDITPGWASQGAIVVSFSVGSTQQSYQCSDGIDNDGDGYVDMQDPACSGTTDNTESPFNQPPQVYACSNGSDDDGDGLIDMQDPGCTSTTDTNEYNVPPPTYQCSNNIDDDADGLVDFSQDPGCTSATDNNEYNTPPQVYQCNDGYDNDSDGLIDMQDPGCSSPMDNTEYNVPPPTYQCSNGIDDDNDGYTDMQDPGCSNTTDNSEFNQNNNGSAPIVTTNSATNIDEDSATIRGYVDVQGGSVTRWFEWGEDDNDLDETENIFGSTTVDGSFSFNLTGLDEDTEYFFRACAENTVTGQEDCGSIEDFTTDEDGSNNDNSEEPDVTTDSATSVGSTSAKLNGNVDPNGDDVEVWFEYAQGNSSSCSFSSSTNHEDGDDDNSDFDISETVSNLQSGTTYCFRAVAENSDGDIDYGNTKTFTTNGYISTPLTVAPQAITTTATAVTQTTARLNGLIMSGTSSGTTSGWFEWGTSASLGRITAMQSFGTVASVNLVDTITGLTPNTTYYFRVVGKNNGGTVPGDVLNFRTSSVSVAPPTTVVISTVNGGNGNSHIMLEIENRYESACVGDSIEQTVKYKNISGRTLEDVVLRVTLPRDVAFVRASEGDFSEKDNTLTILLGTLSPNEEDEISITGTVLRDADSQDLLVTTAIMAYTYNTGVQEDVIAYGIHNVNICTDNGNLLGASALFGFGGFFPTTLFGWLLLILIILAIIVIVRRYYYNNPKIG